MTRWLCVCAAVVGLFAGACSDDASSPAPTGAAGSAGSAGASAAGAAGTTGGAGAGGAGVPASKYPFCDKACSAQSPLDCPYFKGEGQACLSNCEAGADKILQGKPCQDAIAALTTCLLALPAEGVECDDEGEAVPKDGSCTGEIEAVTSCVGG